MECDPNNDSEFAEIEDELVDLIREIASSRPDSYVPAKRRALIEQATELLRGEATARRVLAQDLNDIQCSSLHAHRRVIPLYTLSLLQNDEDGSIVQALLETLTRLLEQANDPALLTCCRKELAGSSSSIATRLSRWLEPLASRSVAAIGIGSGLEQEQEDQFDWLAALLQYSLTHFSTNLDLVQSFLQELTERDWDQSIRQALLLKVKSHPDKSLLTILGWIQHISIAKLDKEWTDILFKHLSGAKEENRAWASQIVVAWSHQSSEALSKWVQLFAGSNVMLAPARMTVYGTLRQLATVVTSNEAKDEVIDTALEGIVSMLRKETKNEHRADGLSALVAWLVVYKQRGGGQKGYKLALELIRSCCAGSKVEQVAPLFGSMLMNFHPDTIESIILDLFLESNFQEILNALISQATTKKAMLSEGVIAVYMSLVHASRNNVPPSSIVAEILSAGSSKKDGKSFLYSSSLMELVESNPVVSLALSRSLVLTTLLMSKGSWSSSPIFTSDMTAASRALAACICHPGALDEKDHYASTAITNGVMTILSVQPEAAMGLVESLLLQTNKSAAICERLVQGLNATREARETDREVGVKGQGSIHASHAGFDAHTVRCVSRALSKHCRAPVHLARVMILMHAGSSLKNEGQQRAKLVFHTLSAIQDVALESLEDIDFQSTLADEIVAFAAHHSMVKNDNGDIAPQIEISASMQKATLSLLVSLGGLASNYSSETDGPEDETAMPYVYCYQLCTEQICPRLGSSLWNLNQQISSFSTIDIEIYMSPVGTLVLTDQAASDSAKKGRKLTEDEEWEINTKMELAKKKGGGEGDRGVALTTEEATILKEQDAKRVDIAKLVEVDFPRTLDSIRQLCLSDIATGNACLPILRDPVSYLAVTKCAATMAIKSIEHRLSAVLTSLAGCVYEIDDIHAPTLAQALLVSCEGVLLDSKRCEINVKALPSPCAPVACAINEMMDVHDALSGPSFAFMFPVLQAALMGMRTPPGCEDALRLIARHTRLLYGQKRDPRVAPLRFNMVVSILELMKHDRSQTFHNPTPFEALVMCYHIDGDAEEEMDLAVSEISVLLDERGALGGRSCRLGAMLVLEHVGRLYMRPGKATSNNEVLTHLVESRVWLNCFDSDEQIRQAARKAWLVMHDAPPTELDNDSGLPCPSILFSPPRLPSLRNTESSDLDTIAALSSLPIGYDLIYVLQSKSKSLVEAATIALARALAMQRDAVAKNLELLGKTYIEVYPTSEGKNAATVSAPNDIPTKGGPLPHVPPKKDLSRGLSLPKKISAPKSALAVAGIGKPKAAKKKPAVSSALLKPKQERVLTPDEFVGNLKSSVPADFEEDSPAKARLRLGVLRVFGALTESTIIVELEVPVLLMITSFLIAYGLADKDEAVRSASRTGLCAFISTYGNIERAVEPLLSQLEGVLKSGTLVTHELGALSTKKIPNDILSSDRRKEGAVVALGSVAVHLKGEGSDSKVQSTVDMLLDTLKTPSEEVQMSIADGLTKLAKKGNTPERLEAILSRLMSDCLTGGTMAIQRGAAYGIAAIVKGTGIGTLKKFDIVKQLENACSGSSNKSREGSLFAIELLSARLGLLFEPYVISLLPSLLKAFSDSSDHVRSAAAHTVEVIMSKLSAHGVKLIMPAVLTAFHDTSWRTKQASIQMLGAMSHLAPKQLASALPKVVPQLTEAFTDTHPKVKSTAQEALNEIGTVVKNPEISSISSILMKALTDPADFTLRALETLIQTEFLHAIDAPSLALIAPILHRGLRDRGATTKRFGGLITGNITTMINDPKDLIPYLPILLPDLQACLLDPIPDVRSTSAKALGSLTRSLGDEILPELHPWLVKKLREQGCSSAERSGAAQGLTEVLIAAGSSEVEQVMLGEILPLQSHNDACTREGVLWVLTFLPPAMGQGFISLLDQSLPAIIAGLSDDNEPVRDVAMRSGRVLIRSHGKHHVDRILPSLEDGLANEDYRIRVASLSLLGDLLSMIGNTTLVKGEGDTQDDIRRAERAQAQIALVLGAETRRRILSGLYLARNDTVHIVRQNALQVWKTVVSVTGRTLREILPDLVSRIITDLASGEEEKTLVAGRCLGDVVSKLGETVLPQIVPVLRNALMEGNEHTRQGVCVGLTEVIKCSTKEQLLRFIEILSKVVSSALCDDDPNVRTMAAISFQSLHSVIGNRALDEIVPSLMVSLEIHDDDYVRVRALNGITSILRVRSRELLPYIIPRLLTRPISVEHANALAGIAAVTGGTLYAHFAVIIPAVLRDLSEVSEENESYAALKNCSRSICVSVSEEGINLLVNEISSKCGSDKASMRKECCNMFETLLNERADKKDFYSSIPIIIRELVYRLNDDDRSVLLANSAAFFALTKHVPAEELVLHINFMKNLIASMVSDARFRKGGVGGDAEFLLPGFNIPNGIEPLLPVFQRGILYGNPEIREVAASGLGEIISLTSSKYLAGPLVVKMTGPLLRVVGDRNPSNVKIAILSTLGLILVKGGPALRAFVPQFQTTFVKALSDPSRKVRLAAIDALSLLMPLTTRVDPLIKELVTGALGQTLNVEGLAAASVQHATLEALAVVIAKAGDKAKLPASMTTALDASKELVAHPDVGVRTAAAKVMGETCSLMEVKEIIELLQQVVLKYSNDTEASSRHGSMCGVRRILECKRGTSLEPVMPRIEQRVQALLNDDTGIVREAATVALGAVIGRCKNSQQGFASHQSNLLHILSDSQETMEMHRAAARSLCVALSMVEGSKRIDAMGLTLIDMCLKLALSGAQRIQFAFNDVLWLALDVSNGDEGLNRYSNIAVFDNIRSMKSLHSKVLSKITECSMLMD